MQKPLNLPVPLVTATFGTLQLVYQSQILNCPENGNDHHFLANTLALLHQTCGPDNNL